MRHLFFLTTCCAICLFLACTPTKEKPATKEIVQIDHAANKKAIINLMNKQADAWSNGDLEKFMEGYWRSDSLRFIGSKGITYGWQQTLDNYKKGYPTADHTGKLLFKILSVEPIDHNNYFVIGEFHLKRKVGDADGMYSLWFRRINGAWKIVVDHSS